MNLKALIKPLISILVLSFFALFISCKKEFDHKELSIKNCDLCNFAKDVEGRYRGLGEGVKFQGKTPMIDSLTIELSQIFLNQSKYEDSTFIYFHANVVYDSILNSNFEDTIQIKKTKRLC
jgi:hypothetical protein